MKQIDIAILGFGTVGSGVYRVATENHEDILHREDQDIRVKRILVRDFEHEPNLHMAPMEKFTTEISDITEDDTISIVVECMGGVEPARSFILSALQAGQTVVTSNKEVMSKHWPEFEAAARASGAGLYLEATVGGGIPILRTITDSLQANNITGIKGIINGTTNFILTKMSEDGADYAPVLKEAQALGYAEANPEADVEGFDAMYKLSILASMAFHAHIPIEYIHREGITALTALDFEMARLLGYEIKLLAIGKKDAEKNIEVRVHPTMIPKSHPLASVRGSFNAIFLTGNAVDDVMLYGRGAGQMPTASAVMGDVIYAGHTAKHRYMTFRNQPSVSPELRLATDWESIYCIRVRVADRPGVLSGIAGAFAAHGVSLKSVLQPGESVAGEARITFVTHTAHERALQSALREIAGLPTVAEVESVIRVEE